MSRLGVDITSDRSPDGPCADLCRFWYGAGYCTGQAQHDGLCLIHTGKPDIKELALPVPLPAMERQMARRAKKEARDAARFVVAVPTAAQPAAWPSDEREQAAMEYLGLSPRHNKLDAALRQWRAGKRLAEIRRALEL